MTTFLNSNKTLNPNHIVLYVKSIWNETRGDDFDDWGTSIWYFELDFDKYPIRQIEVYQNGNRLKYSIEHIDDMYGSLGDQRMELEEMNGVKIIKAEFESEWEK